MTPKPLVEWMKDNGFRIEDFDVACDKLHDEGRSQDCCKFLKGIASVLSEQVSDMVSWWYFGSTIDDARRARQSNYSPATRLDYARKALSGITSTWSTKFDVDRGINVLEAERLGRLQVMVFERWCKELDAIGPAPTKKARRKQKAKEDD